MIRAVRAAASELIALEGVFEALWADVGDIELRGPRARQATISGLAVVISVTIAMACRLDLPWWAAISGLLSVQATRPGSWERASLRVVGTAAGAGAALLLSPWIVADHVAGSLFLFVTASIGILGCIVSRHSYAWLFFGVTANLVILMSIDAPEMALHFAFYRIFEVTIGSTTALLLVLVLAPDGDPPPSPAAPGWSDLLGARWPAVLHATRTGVTVMLLPWTWAYFDLPGLSQMAVTVAAVMAVPVLRDHPLEQGRLIAGRAAQRVIGCFAGGAVALLLLAVSPEAFLPWLVLLAAGAWVGAWIQTSTRGVGYIGTQAGVVFLITVIQGWGPPDSILPGIDRLAGIVLGVVFLLVISLLFWPAQPVDQQDKAG